MPKVRPLTQKQRDEQAIQQEIQRTCQLVLDAAREKRGREDKTYSQVAEDIGVCTNTFLKWRKGKLPEASFGGVIEACARMGYRLALEPFPSHR